MKYVCIKEPTPPINSYYPPIYKYHIYDICANNETDGIKKSIIFDGYERLITDNTINKYFIELNEYRKLKLKRLL